MIHRIFLCTVALVVGAIGLVAHADPAFSFLYVAENDVLPHLRFQEVVSGQMKDFHGGQKRPLVLIFWGADLDTKRERAIEVLGYIQQSRAFFQERNIELAAVFVQPDQQSLMAEVVGRVQMGFPVYVDIENQSFEKLGVYVMPSILMVDADGIIYKGLGYNHNLDEILRGEIEVMLHEKTREELEAELHPQVIERTTAQRQARLDYNYALQLVQRHRIDLALEKLDLALVKDPELVQALIEKGCLLVKKKKFQEAGDFLDQGLTLEPGFERALACKVELKAAEGQKDEGEEAPGKLDPASWGFFAVDEDEEGESAE